MAGLRRTIAFVIVRGTSRRIVGWRVSRGSARNFVLDALEQAHLRIVAVTARCSRPGASQRPRHAVLEPDALHHASGWPNSTGIALSVASRGDAYDDALAETISVLFNRRMIDSTTRRCGVTSTRSNADRQLACRSTGSTARSVYWNRSTSYIRAGGVRRAVTMSRLRSTQLTSFALRRS